MKLFKLALATSLLVAPFLLSAESFEVENEASQGKKFGVSLRGGLINAMPGTGAQFEYRLNPKMHVGVIYTEGEDKDGSKGGGYERNLSTGMENFFDYQSEARMSSQMYGAFGRYFFSETFHASAGLVQRNLKVVYNQVPAPISMLGFDDRYDTYADGSVSGSTIALMFQIGNRWEWNNGFFIGADWVGGTVPLAKISESGNADDVDELDFKESDEYKKMAKNMSKLGLVQALILDVGFAF